jgi:hypothetical protein
MSTLPLDQSTSSGDAKQSRLSTVYQMLLAIANRGEPVSPGNSCDEARLGASATAEGESVVSDQMAPDAGVQREYLCARTQDSELQMYHAARGESRQQPSPNEPQRLASSREVQQP